jgi:hypothetical protein
MWMNADVTRGKACHTQARHQWHMPVILITQEAEIRRITVRSQPGQIVQETLFWKIPSQKRAGGLAQGVGPEFNPQYCKKKKKPHSHTANANAGVCGSGDRSQDDNHFPEKGAFQALEGRWRLKAFLERHGDLLLLAAVCVNNFHHVYYICLFYKT